MRVGAMSVAGAALLAAAGLVAVPSGVAVAVTGCTSVFDVNGDRVGDTAIGAAAENVGRVKDAGSVTIVYGSLTGRTFGSASSKLVTQETFGGISETNDRFGESIAIGDLNKDGCKDLVIGVPGENRAAGRVQVAFGSPSGVSFAQRQSISQDSTGVPGGAEVGDEFGAAVAVQGSGTATWLWVGAPGENLGRATGAGSVVRIPAGNGGSSLATSGIAGYSQGSGSVPGGAETGDRFGTVISATAHSVLIGVPREDAGKIADAGVVYAYTGTWKVMSQDSTGPTVPGGAEAGDRFGASVAQVPSCTGNASDEAYVIGSPSENIGTTADAGTVTVVDVRASSTLLLQQGDTNLPGTTAEAGDLFGLRVAAHGNLVVAAAPEEDIGTLKNAGSAHQAVLGCDGSTPTVVTSSVLDLDPLVVPGDPGAGDRFGLGLAFSWISDGDDGPVLLIGAPLKADGSVLDSGRVTVFSTKDVDGLFGGTGSKAFGQSSSGIAGGAETGDQFGASIGTNNF